MPEREPDAEEAVSAPAPGAEDDAPVANPEPSPLEPRTWREIGADLLRPGRSQVVLAVILLLCGLGVTMQITAQRDQRYSTLRQDELVAMLDDVTGETRRLESDIATLERTRDQLATGADADAVARAEAHRRLDALELLGGTVPARGPGIRITISDPQGKLTPEILLNAVEELRDAGAEVLAVGDVRLVATSRKFGLRNFEFISISMDDPETLPEVKAFLEKQNAIVPAKLNASLKAEGRNGNAYVFNNASSDALIQALDPEWPGPIPHTLVVAPGGEVIYRHNGIVDGDELREKILEHMGRFYVPEPEKK